MAVLNKIGLITEEVRHKATVVKTQAEFAIKSKYIDIKYYLKNMKNVVKKELGCDVGITELFKQQDSYMLDKTKAASILQVWLRKNTDILHHLWCRTIIPKMTNCKLYISGIGINYLNTENNP